MEKETIFLLKENIEGKMSIDQDVKKFVDVIGAKEPSADGENHAMGKAYSRRSK